MKNEISLSIKPAAEKHLSASTLVGGMVFNKLKACLRFGPRGPPFLNVYNSSNTWASSVSAFGDCAVTNEVWLVNV